MLEKKQFSTKYRLLSTETYPRINMVSDQRDLPSQMWSKSSTIYLLNLIHQTAQMKLRSISISGKPLTRFPTNQFSKICQNLVLDVKVVRDNAVLLNIDVKRT